MEPIETSRVFPGRYYRVGGDSLWPEILMGFLEEGQYQKVIDFLQMDLM